MCRAPAKPSSPGWNMKITVPGTSSCRAQSSLAAPASMAVCRSWPQACIAPGIADAYGSPVSSVTGSASMSPRSSTTGPEPERRPPRSTAVTELTAVPVLISSGSPASASSTLRCVFGRSRPISGSRVDRMPQLGDLARQLRRLVAYQHEVPPQLGAPGHPIAHQPGLPRPERPSQRTSTSSNRPDVTACRPPNHSRIRSPPAPRWGEGVPAPIYWGQGPLHPECPGPYRGQGALHPEGPRPLERRSTLSQHPCHIST